MDGESANAVMTRAVAMTSNKIVDDKMTGHILLLNIVRPLSINLDSPKGKHNCFLYGTIQKGAVAC